MNSKRHPVEMLHRVIVLCLTVAMFASMLIGCSEQPNTDGQSPATASTAIGSPEPTASTEPVDENARGNTVGNIVNGGRVAQQGDWIYYYNDADSENYPNAWDASDISNTPDTVYGLFKSRLGTDKTFITHVANAVFINVIDDWIYYIEGGFFVGRVAEDLRQGYIYKIRTDGTEKTQLTEDNCWYMSVIGDWIYYANVSDGGRIYKMRTDGSEKARVNDDESACLNVVDGWIYYANQSDGGKIYKVSTDGKGQMKLNDDESVFINAVDGWIYYSNQSDGLRIYKIRMDGTERTKLCDDENCSYVNVTGDRVYYQLNIETKTTSQFNGVWRTQYNKAWNLYSMSTDGAEQLLLCEKESLTSAGSLSSKFWYSLYVVEDEASDLYVCKPYGAMALLCKVPTDGTEPQRVE